MADTASESHMSGQLYTVKTSGLLIAFLVRLMFLRSCTSVPGRVPLLHGYGRNARSVTKYAFC